MEVISVNLSFGTYLLCLYEMILSHFGLSQLDFLSETGYYHTCPEIHNLEFVAYVAQANIKYINFVPMFYDKK